ncbi:hypothetical protein C2G38_2159181 [Gigaspora rosea]|uniref:Uncharacterized protein n=1 Tax=Gigaspora rosea TaxID=44941 RepID=A0A397VZQ4_9GLOM|nr:hypothetical protein C2G38_2159181 [Gigaspora rosea]
MEMFVQNYQSDLVLSIQQFIPSTLLEAVEKTQFCEMTIVHILLVAKPVTTSAISLHNTGNQKRVEHLLNWTRLTTAAHYKISCYKYKNKIKEKKEKFVNLLIVAELDNELWKKVLVKKLRSKSKKSESKEYGVLDKKDTSDKGEITDSPEGLLEDI